MKKRTPEEIKEEIEYWILKLKINLWRLKRHYSLYKEFCGG
jgi:hypothetical protein